MATRSKPARKPIKESRKGLRGTRRRLSVVSDNKLIEGIASLGVTDDEHIEERKTEHVIKNYAGISKKGYAPYNPRKRNQDAILMEEHGPTGTVVFGVLDGHGEAGDLVSHYFTERIAARLFRNPQFVTNPGRAMKEEVDRLERSLLADASIDTEFSGSTSVMCTIRERTITVANIGDSRIVVARAQDGALKAIDVSQDHKPDREDEERRIVASGGRVFAVEYEDGISGPPRVWLGHMDIPGLAMSRSLGDTVAHTAGVISEPELHTFELTEDDKMVILASDGLWEFMSSQEVVDFIARVPSPERAVDMLVAEASARWMKEEAVIDDTTIIIAYLR